MLKEVIVSTLILLLFYKSITHNTHTSKQTADVDIKTAANQTDKNLIQQPNLIEQEANKYYNKDAFSSAQSIKVSDCLANKLFLFGHFFSLTPKLPSCFCNR